MTHIFDGKWLVDKKDLAILGFVGDIAQPTRKETIIGSKVREAAIGGTPCILQSILTAPL